MFSLSLSLAYLQLIVLGGSVTSNGSTVTIPTGARYLSFHENNPLETSLEVSSRQQVSLEVDVDLIAALNTNIMQFSDFNTTSSVLYCSLWTAATGGVLLAYTEVSIPSTIISEGILVIEPQTFVFQPSMCG